MSDGLSPVEQARAARWVKDWLLKCEFVEAETARDAITALGFYIDQLDPPETVESLRAERDTALFQFQQVAADWRQEQMRHQTTRNERDEARVKSDKHLSMFDQACADREAAAYAVDDARAELARLRATHTQAEAAWGRCQRED